MIAINGLVPALLIALSVEIAPSPSQAPEFQIPCNQQEPQAEKTESQIVCGPTKEKKQTIKRPKKKAPDAYRQPKVPR